METKAQAPYINDKMHDHPDDTLSLTIKGGIQADFS